MKTEIVHISNMLSVDLLFIFSVLTLYFFLRYGGKFGVQSDRMDKSAVGHDYIGKTEKHVSQKDYAQGIHWCIV